MSASVPRVPLAPAPGGRLDLVGFVAQIAPSREVTAGRARRSAPLLALVALGLAVTVLISHGPEFAAAVGRAVQANWMLVIAAGIFEVGSVGGYVFLQHRVVSAASTRLRWRDSYDISLAGTAATRLLPTAGLGGAAVTVWALRARGVAAREVAERMLAFLVLLYGVYMGALLVAGAAVGAGLVHVPHGRGLGFAAAGIGAAVVAIVGIVLAAPGPLARALECLGEGPGRTASLAKRARTGVPALRAALERAGQELRGAHPALLGAVAWWAFDIAVLFAMLGAFGAHPGVVALVMAYFLGTMFNVVPLPGALSGGLAGVLIALGTPAAPAIAAVLAYRTVAVWIPATAGLLSVGRLRLTVGRWQEENHALSCR